MDPTTFYYLAMDYKRFAQSIDSHLYFYAKMLKEEDAEELKSISKRLKDLKDKMKKMVEDAKSFDPVLRAQYLRVIDE